MPRLRGSAGFTLIELLVVMGIIAVLASLSFVNFARPQAAANASGAASVLVTDLKSQQLRAMSGDSASATSAQAYGVYVQSASYTLFKGTSYSAADADNVVIPAEQGIAFSSNLPSGQVVFQKGSGEVTSYSGATNTITITGQGGQSRTITFNALGAITEN